MSKITVHHGIGSMSGDNIVCNFGSKPSCPDMFGDCQEFCKLYNERTGSHFKGKIDRNFITQMVMDELQELAEAKDEAEEVDALLDATYYILNHLAGTGLDIRPIWTMIHNANMSKFGPGGYKRESDGKWCKPPDFVHPDDDIRAEVARQRKQE
jgi:predicted HAD superfamily Cof-like phosphohydrolase